MPNSRKTFSVLKKTEDVFQELRTSFGDNEIRPTGRFLNRVLLDGLPVQDNGRYQIRTSQHALLDDLPKRMATYVFTDYYLA